MEVGERGLFVVSVFISFIISIVIMSYWKGLPVSTLFAIENDEL